MVSSLLSLAVVSMAGLAQARFDLFQPRASEECCPCPASGSPGPQSPVTVTVTQPGPATPDTVTVYVTQGLPGPSESAKETVTVNHTVTAPGTTVTAPGTTVYIGGSTPPESSRPQQTNLPGPGHGSPSGNENKAQKPSVITHTVFLPNQSAQPSQTRSVSVTTVTATLPQDNIQQPEATGPRPSSKTLSPNNSNGGGAGNSQTPNSQAPNGQTPNNQAPDTQVPDNQAPNNQAPNGQAPDGQSPNRQAPTIETVTVPQVPHPSVQTVTVTQGNINSQPVDSADVVTVTAGPNPQSIPPYVQQPELYQTVTQTIHNGDDINVEINIINIFNGETFCIIQDSGLPCGHDVVINNANNPQPTANSPKGVTAAAPLSMATTTSCPTPQNSTSIATVYNTVTATISQGRGANDTSGLWATRPTGTVGGQARVPRSPVRKLW